MSHESLGPHRANESSSAKATARPLTVTQATLASGAGGAAIGTLMALAALNSASAVESALAVLLFAVMGAIYGSGLTVFRAARHSHAEACVLVWAGISVVALSVFVGSLWLLGMRPNGEQWTAFVIMGLASALGGAYYDLKYQSARRPVSEQSHFE